jgi:hypothetical protein
MRPVMGRSPREKVLSWRVGLSTHIDCLTPLLHSQTRLHGAERRPNHRATPWWLHAAIRLDGVNIPRNLTDKGSLWKQAVIATVIWLVTDSNRLTGSKKCWTNGGSGKALSKNLNKWQICSILCSKFIKVAINEVIYMLCRKFRQGKWSNYFDDIWYWWDILKLWENGGKFLSSWANGGFSRGTYSCTLKVEAVRPSETSENF